MKTEEFTDAKQFLAAAYGRKRAVAARPGLPRAGRAEATGLSMFILKGWNFEMVVGLGFRLWSWDGRTTAFCETEKACCDAAKELTQ